MTGQDVYGAGARRWLGRMLDTLDDDVPETLCNGAIGNALVLASALWEVAPTWEACLGLSW